MDTHPASLAEGRIAIVTRREAGRRWTRRHRATNDAKADDEAVWFWRPDAGAKFATMLLAFAPMTVTKKLGLTGKITE